ncbi:MAG TPA: S8 family serine peptidase, partial [Phnomibacter sp.]|nr:S8 family serine peptidase [Phnomibacter sp.]
MRQAIAILGIFLLTGTLAWGQTIHPDYVDGQLYVRLKSAKNPKTGKDIHPSERFDRANHPFNTFLAEKFRVKPFGRAFRENASPKLNATLLFEFENFAAVDEIMRELKKDKNVELVEKVPLIKRSLVPNDPSFANQWALTKIQASGAWNYFSTGSNIVIAIVDDAVERNHPDLSANIWVNPKEIPGNGIDDDGNGYVDDINGWDFADNDNNPDPPTTEYYHGTHVAGIASATTNNNTGMASIGFSCKLMCIKSAGANPRSLSSIATYGGIIYAANNGANIINCSWGSKTFSSTNQETIDYAISKGSIVVAAAGNDASSELYYPATYIGVISVASTDVNDVKSGFSNYGSWVKISAPGSSIYSTIPNSTYGN